MGHQTHLRGEVVIVSRNHAAFAGGYGLVSVE
jgi:hypothetical protein